MVTTLLALLLGALPGDANCTLLHFTASQCQPCEQQQPVIDQLRRSSWDVRSIDTYQQLPLARQFNVRNLPTLIILCNGQEVDRLVGVASHTEIEKRLFRAAARAGAPPTIASSSAGPRGSLVQPNSLAGQPAEKPGPIVRGQSPAISRAAAGAVANTLISGGISTEPRRSDRGSSAPKPSLSLDQAIARAARATVRIRVDEGNTVAHGTGTIVDVRGDEALVLTCGHLFREMLDSARLTVDLFAGTPQEVNVPAELVDFSADGDLDIGLVSMRIPVMIEPVEILPRHEELRVNQPVFSFGCDHGDSPSRRDTRISRINRYIGAANVEIIGAPAVGRSGGGLFDEQGRLIGVCNAANAQEDEGIYAAADVVYAQLEKLDLSELFDANPRNPSGSSPSAMLASGPSKGQAISHSQAQRRGAGEKDSATQGGNSGSATYPDGNRLNGSAQPGWPDERADLAGSLPPAEAEHSSQPATSRAANTAQIICILRSERGDDRLVTINSPSPELLELIRSNAQSLDAPR